MTTPATSSTSQRVSSDDARPAAPRDTSVGADAGGGLELGAVPTSPCTPTSPRDEDPSQQMVTPDPRESKVMREVLLVPGDDCGDSSDGADGRHGIARRLRRTPVWSVTANNIAFMCVPRGIPACFAATGWPLGLTALLYSCVVTYDTGHVLGEACALRPSCSSFPELTGEAFVTLARSRRCSEPVAEWWRAVGRAGTQLLQFATYYLTGVAELIYFEQYCGQLFSSAPICQWQWLLLIAAVSLPVLQVPSFHESRWVAVFIGCVPLLLNVVIFFYEIFTVQPWRCEPGPSYTPPSYATRSTTRQSACASWCR